MKKFLIKILIGEPKGETIDLSVGKPRIKSTVEPDQTLGFNEFWTRVYAENKRLSGY